MNDHDEIYSFTKNSLSIKLDTIFWNVVSFMRFINHYVITNELDYFILKSDQTQFTSRCKSIDCEWNIFVSIMHDDITFEVSTYLIFSTISIEKYIYVYFII